ncbi:MAG: AmmeMemoRadiSam system protein B [Candidatus Cloacimonetes bacterium]|nr:AmmeMemoRadiSam system protein B [Candidatus Cloacimonadota bacterium]
MIRQPVVAGTFYTSNPKALRNQVETFLENALVKKVYSDILGIISPHAGYICSGQCAAYGFNAIMQKDFDMAVIIAPSHRVGGFKFSLGKYEAYNTPLGNVTVDIDTVESLLEEDGFSFIPAAHNYEHSLEVQLPFLQVVKPEARIVPIIFGNQSAENSAFLADKLANYFRDRLKGTVFIVSSDLSHYHDSIRAQEMDGKLAGLVEKSNIRELVSLLQQRDIEACGYGGILTLLYMAEKLHYDKIENLEYTHSGNVTYDYSQVVGYLSTAIYR